MFIRHNKDVGITASDVLHGTFHLLAFTVHTEQSYAFRFEIYVLDFNHHFIVIIFLSTVLRTYRPSNSWMWNYWCIFPPSLGKLAFLAPWENKGKEAEVFSIKCDWIGFYKMNCQDKSLSQLHCQEVSVLLQPLWSTAIRVSFELSGSVIVRRCLQCEQKVDKCNRPTFATAKSGLWFGPRIHEITHLTAKTWAEQNTAVFFHSPHIF